MGFDKNVLWYLPILTDDDKFYSYCDLLLIYPTINETNYINPIASSLKVEGYIDYYFTIHNYSAFDPTYPLDLIRGRMPQTGNEVVISESASNNYTLGDTIRGTYITETIYKDGKVMGFTTDTIEVTVVGICSKNSLTLINGYHTNHDSDLISFFSTVEEEELSTDPPQPCMFFYNNSVIKPHFALSAFVIPADGYSPDDVVALMNELELPGKYQTYEHMLTDYNNYYSNVIKASCIIGSVVIFLLFVSIFTGAGLGIESNARKIAICCQAGARSQEVFALSMLSYLPSILLGNLLGFSLFIFLSKNWAGMSYIPSGWYIAILLGVEAIIFLLIFLPYYFRKEYHLDK